MAIIQLNKSGNVLEHNVIEGRCKIERMLLLNSCYPGCICFLHRLRQSAAARVETELHFSLDWRKLAELFRELGNHTSQILAFVKVVCCADEYTSYRNEVT